MTGEIWCLFQGDVCQSWKLTWGANYDGPSSCRRRGGASAREMETASAPRSSPADAEVGRGQKEPAIFDGLVAGHRGAADGLKTSNIHVCVCPHFGI